MALTRWGKKRETLKIAEEFLGECCNHLGLNPKMFSKSARRLIMMHHWGDNGLMLKRAIYGAALASSDHEISAGHFVACSRRDRHELLDVQARELALDELMRERIGRFYERLQGHDVEGVYKAILDQVEKPLVEETLCFVRGNKLKAARILGINRNTLARKMRVFNIPVSGRA